MAILLFFYITIGMVMNEHVLNEIYLSKDFSDDAVKAILNATVIPMVIFIYSCWLFTKSYYFTYRIPVIIQKIKI